MTNNSQALNAVLQIPMENIRIEPDNSGLREFMSGTGRNAAVTVAPILSLTASSLLRAAAFSPAIMMMHNAHHQPIFIANAVLTSRTLGPILGPEYYAQQLARAFARAAALTVCTSRPGPFPFRDIFLVQGVDVSAWCRACEHSSCAVLHQAVLQQVSDFAAAFTE
jgi:hypothetical protein